MKRIIRVYIGIMATYLEQQKQNHKTFINLNDFEGKLRLSAKNVVLQCKAAMKAFNEIEKIANDLGYDIDTNTGEMIKRM